MNCPYCSAPVEGKRCQYCGSLMPFYEKQEAAMPPYERAAKEFPELAKYFSGSVTQLYFFTDDLDFSLVSDRNFQDVIDEIFRIAPNEFAAAGPSAMMVRPVTRGKIKTKLFDILGVPEDERIIIAHDDTMLKTGKNGFAITESGFYTKALMEKPWFISWDQFAKINVCVLSNGEMHTDFGMLAYITGDNETEAAMSLLKKLWLIYSRDGQSMFNSLRESD